MIETCKQDGVFRTSKLLWTLGNYSFFIRPGMVRLSSVTSTDNTAEVMASAYADNFFKRIVVVLVNSSREDKMIDLSFQSLPAGYCVQKYKLYETSVRSDLQYKGIVGSQLLIPARSVVTLVGVE